jgi:hypothetical protein
MNKRPSFQFYPADWRKDTALQRCSIAARGLWIELMCIAHECEEYGKLGQNGEAFSHKTLAKLVGLSPQTCKKLLAELERNKVFSRDDNGIIFSRRMIKDEELRNIRAKAGSMGGNPDLLGDLVKQNGKQKPTPSSSSSYSSSSSIIKTTTESEITNADEKVNLPPNLPDATKVKQKPTPSSSSSSSPSIEEYPENLKTTEFQKAWTEYQDYRKNRHLKTLLPASQKAQLKRMSEWGHDIAIKMIEESIANGWQGIFEPKAGIAGTFNKPIVKPKAIPCL